MKHTKLEGGFPYKEYYWAGLNLNSLSTVIDARRVVASGSRGTRNASRSLCLRGRSGGVLLLLLGFVQAGIGVLLVLVDSPVENVVVLEALAHEQVTEDLAQVAVVRLVVEAQGACVVQVNGELVGETTAEDLGRSGHLLLHDAVVLLLLGRSLQALPRQRAAAEVEHNIAQRLHVVTTRLLFTRSQYTFRL